MKIIIIFSIILLIAFCFIYKVKIKWKTFFKRGFSAVRGNFGIYCYCGKQGTGKTYSVVEYLLDNKKNSRIWCNIKDIKNLDYTEFTGFTELIQIKEFIDSDDFVDDGRQLVIVYDEIFTELQKGSKLSKDVLDFLCQMRKRKIIFLTTAQEWAEIPISFRRFCRYEIDTHMINLGLISILWKQFKDAENMKWSEMDQEFVAPLVSNTITKTRKYIGNSYDTYLRISSTEVKHE